MTNDLIAEPESGDWTSGVGFLSDGKAPIDDLNSASASGVDIAVDSVMETLDILGLVLDPLGGVFAAEMAKGRLRQAEPEVMSRVLIGSLHHFCMTELFMGEPKSRFTHRDFAEQVVDVLLANREGTK
jgi:hypothetical protein